MITQSKLPIAGGKILTYRSPVCQFLSGGAAEITLDGVGDDRLRLKAEPWSWTVPVSIAEDALNPTLLDRAEFIDRGDDDEEGAEPADDETSPEPDANG